MPSGPFDDLDVTNYPPPVHLHPTAREAAVAFPAVNAYYHRLQAAIARLVADGHPGAAGVLAALDETAAHWAAARRSGVRLHRQLDQLHVREADTDDRY